MIRFRPTRNIEPAMHRDKQAFGVYAPMNFFVVYVIFTLILHVLGPWEYKDEVLWQVVIYISLAMLFFVLGYRSIAARYVKKIYRDEAICENNYRRLIGIAKTGLVLQILLNLLLAASDYADGRLSFEGLLNPGQAYIDALELNRDGGGTVSFVGQIKTLFSPWMYFADAFLLFNYSRISVRWRLILVFTLSFQLVHGALIKAAQKGFFDLFILFTSVGILRVYFDRARFIKLAKYSLAFLFGVVAIFALFQLSRMNAYDALDYSGVDRMKLDRDGLLFSILGDSLGLATSLFVGYLSQGYYGLSLCLQLPFEWTYGLGNSFALASYAEQYLGVASVADNTYPSRMEAYFGWPAKMYWHTFFPWVASDLTFIGAIILMYLIGRSYARSFIDGVVFESPLGICVFYFISTLMIYLPANNQLMQTREMMIGTLVLVITWLVFGKKFRRRIR
jgi:hypothetical protein